jgi:hypothetical protein
MPTLNVSHESCLTLDGYLLSHLSKKYRRGWSYSTVSFSRPHVQRNALCNVKDETFSVRNILLRSLFTCVRVTPCAIAVAARKSCIVYRYLSRVSILARTQTTP